jgi:hypothetical protein
MQIQTYFTKDKKVKKIILNHLDKAQNHVCVAVAWFTDRVLFDKLIELLDRGVQVELIITNHEFNHKSANDYKVIEQKAGFFAEIGNDDQLMHMKFCVIDYATVISGSANWTNRAFTVNNEEVTIVEGYNIRANEFIAEFERLKFLSGKIQVLEKELNISKALKTFDLIKAFINLGEVQAIQPYIHQLKNIEELNEITACLLKGEYEIANRLMDVFKKSFSQLMDITAIEKEKILSQIKLLSYQIETLSLEKADTEALIEQFNHRYIIELNPLISNILKLKKKIYERLRKHGIFDDTYEIIEEEFRKNNEEYQAEIKIDIPDLSDDENMSLKEMYREASKYCHPDSSRCIYEDKNEASAVFNDLTQAYKRKDIERVKHLLNELRLGKPIDNLNSLDELELLRAKLVSLQSKYNVLVYDLKELRLSDIFLQIKSILNWNEYFEEQKRLLEEQYENLTKEFVNHEERNTKI